MWGKLQTHGDKKNDAEVLAIAAAGAPLDVMATLNWNTMYSYATKMMNPNKNIQITLRAAMQNDNKNGGYTYKGLRVVLGGRPKELNPGKLKRADTMSSTTTLEVTRYLMEVDGQTVIDIDKFAGRYYVDGEDMRAEINALI